MAIEVFGAGAVQSAYVSYILLDITANDITLLWPTTYVNAPYISPEGIHYDILAASMQVITNGSPDNTFKISLPDATMSSVGSNFIISNIGAGSFTLYKADGTHLINVIAAGESWWVQLTDNTSLDGQWAIVKFGTGTSQADAVALAGNGLVPIGLTLNADTPIVTVAVAPTIDASFRAKMILWRGGNDTLVLPPIGSIPAGYYVSFNNEGNSQIVIRPTENDRTIDRESSLEVQVQQSLTIISDGVNWWTLGFGQNQFAVTTINNQDVSAGIDVHLENVEAASLIQNYIGLLNANITVYFPITTNYWFVSNATDNASTGNIAVQLEGGVGASYIVPKGTKQIFYSATTNLGPSLFRIPTALALDSPLAISSGGTSGTTQVEASNNILPVATDGSLLYWSQVDLAWLILPIGAVGNVLTVVNVGGGRLLPRWV